MQGCKAQTTRSVIGMSRLGDLSHIAVIALALVAAPLSARDQDKPVANQTPDAEDVAMTPITDLNLNKDEIPPVLLAAAEDPYASAGLASCADITAALAPLDSVLGPDMDVAEQENDRVSAGAVAKSVVASFIPFRGIIRELSGAAEHQRNFQAAIYAGAVRRGFLKGLGQRMDCPYPARPAFARVVAPTAPAKVTPRAAAPATASEQGTFVSRPVVQGEASATPQRP